LPLQTTKIYGDEIRCPPLEYIDVLMDDFNLPTQAGYPKNPTATATATTIMGATFVM
jgi:hypothetical protein